MARTKTAFKPTLSDRVFDIFNFTFMMLVMIVTLYPFLNVLAISLNDSVDTVRGESTSGHGSLRWRTTCRSLNTKA